MKPVTINRDATREEITQALLGAVEAAGGAIVDLGSRDTDIVRVNGEITPHQNAGASYANMVEWMYGEGGYPALIVSAEDYEIGTVDDSGKITWTGKKAIEYLT